MTQPLHQTKIYVLSLQTSHILHNILIYIYFFSFYYFSSLYFFSSIFYLFYRDNYLFDINDISITSLIRAWVLNVHFERNKMDLNWLKLIKRHFLYPLVCQLLKLAIILLLSQQLLNYHFLLWRYEHYIA